MYKKYSKKIIFSLIFKTLAIVSIIVTFLLLILNNEFSYKGIILITGGIVLFCSLVDLILEWIKIDRENKRSRIGFLVFDIILLIIGLFSLIFSIIYI